MAAGEGAFEPELATSCSTASANACRAVRIRVYTVNSGISHQVASVRTGISSSSCNTSTAR